MDVLGPAPCSRRGKHRPERRRQLESNRLGEVDGTKGIVSTRFYDSGEMSLGLSRTTQLTKSGKADLNIGWVRRFGPNLTKERREFWDIDLNVVINF